MRPAGKTDQQHGLNDHSVGKQEEDALLERHVANSNVNDPVSVERPHTVGYGDTIRGGEVERGNGHRKQQDAPCRPEAAVPGNPLERKNGQSPAKFKDQVCRMPKHVIGASSEPGVQSGLR